MNKKFKTPLVAETIRRLLDAWALGKRLDPWLAFPQTMCCYSFGENKVPLPIGALKVLWKKYPDFKTTCPECGSTCYGVAFGGLLSGGGIFHVCIGCDLCWFMVRGNFGTMGRLVADGPLQATPFKLKGGLFGGAFPSDGEELMKKLGVVGPAESLGKVSFSVDVGNIQGGHPADQPNDNPNLSTEE